MTELQIIEDFNRGTGQMNNLVAQLLALDLDCDWSTRREAADTLLALQTQLAAAELKAKEWIDVAYEAASQKEELKRELERVERETIERCAKVADGEPNKYAAASAIRALVGKREGVGIETHEGDRPRLENGNLVCLHQRWTGRQVE